MKKRIISTIIVAVLLASTLFAGTASALMMGNLNDDNEITAADARIALRASVSLETLTEEQEKAADVNYDGDVTAADARIILRASVGLEEIETREHPEYHPFTTISTTNKTKCSFDGCETELPSFNDIVNILKSTEDGVDYYTGFVEDITHNDKMEMGGTLGGLMDDETNIASTETTYSALLVNRLLTPSNFPANGENYVSDITDNDIKSIEIAKVDAIDFAAALPDNYTVGKTTYDLTPIKNAEFSEVYKITLVLNSETLDIKKPVTGKSVYDKIYLSDYNSKLEMMRSEISSNLDTLTNEMSSIGVSMSTSGSITSSLTVEYFISTDTFEPIAAKYGNRFDVKFSAAVPILLSMKQNMYMASNSYYFFNNDFGIDA